MRLGLPSIRFSSRTPPLLLVLGALGLAGAGASAPLSAAARPRAKPPSAAARDPNLVWQDEFNGRVLDPAKWSYRGLGPRKGGVNVKEAVTLDGKGHLAITTSKVGGKYHTGMIGTQGKFERAYGYFECRVTFQRQIGHWSAFWLQSPRLGKVLGDPGASGTEIDIFEYLRRRPDELQHNLHWDGYGKHHKAHGTRRKIPGLGAGWHEVVSCAHIWRLVFANQFAHGRHKL